MAINETINTPAMHLKVTLADNANAQAATKAVDAVCTALVRQEASVERLRILLGKLLARVQDSRLFEPAFQSFEAWSQDLATRHKLSRSTIRESLMVARRLPDLTPDQAEVIPMTNLALVARAVKDIPGAEGAMAPADVKKLLHEAATTPVAEFRSALQERGLLAGVGESDGSVRITLQVPEGLAKRWRDIVGDQDPVDVLTRCITLYKQAAKSAKATAALGGRSAAA